MENRALHGRIRNGRWDPMRCVSCLILSISLVVLIAWCGPEYQESRLRVWYDDIFVGFPPTPESEVVVGFNRRVASANIMIDGAPVDAVTDDNKTYIISIWTICSLLGLQYDCISRNDFPLNLTMTVEAEEEVGQELQVFTIDLCISHLDTYSWSICGRECAPKNHSYDVDPEDFPEGLTVAFNDPVGVAEVISVQPTFSFESNLAEDRKKLEIKFIDYTMPYATNFIVIIHVEGGSLFFGGPEDLLYSFATMGEQ